MIEENVADEGGHKQKDTYTHLHTHTHIPRHTHRFGTRTAIVKSHATKLTILLLASERLPYRKATECHLCRHRRVSCWGHILVSWRP